MIKKVQVAAAAVLMSLGAYSTLYAQSWTPFTASGLMYTAPSTTKVGIGTTSPSSLLQVAEGDLKIGAASGTYPASNRLLIGDGDYIQLGEFTGDDQLDFKAKNFLFMPSIFNGRPYSGSVGIGTTTFVGSEKLNVKGQAIVDGDLQVYKSLAVTGASTFTGEVQANNSLVVGGAATFKNTVLFNYGLSIENASTIRLGGTSTFSMNGVGQFAIDAPGVVGGRFLVKPDGTVCIGCTDSKGFKLGVNGSIAAKAVDVRVDLWADYVFDKNYALPSLYEVEKHIEQCKHLPGVPSETEIKASGINVAKMDALLMQKIEENTLYLIDLQKQNDVAKQQLTQLKQQNELLQKQILVLEQLLQQQTK